MGYAAAARRHGARIIRHCAVTDIEISGGALTAVVTAHGRIATDTVVCAAGALSRSIGEMVGVHIPVTPVRRQVAFTEPITELPASSPSLTIDFPADFYFHPEGKGLLLGWSDPNEPAGFNLKFELEDWLIGLGEIAATRAPAVLDYGISTGWAGLYEITPDCNQIIDRSTEAQGLLIATGYSGHGFLMGPAPPGRSCATSITANNPATTSARSPSTASRAPTSPLAKPTSSDRRLTTCHLLWNNDGLTPRTAGSCRADRRLTRLGNLTSRTVFALRNPNLTVGIHLAVA